MMDESKERDIGKQLYLDKEELTGEESKLIKEGYNAAKRREFAKEQELEKIKHETERLKLEKARDLAKLDKLKVKEEIRKQSKKSDGGGW